MTHQDKIDKQLVFNQLWDEVGIDLIDMVAVQLLTLSSNQQHIGNSLLGLSYKSAGLKLQSAHSELMYANLLDEFHADTFGA